MLFRRPIRKSRRPETGYILITLILFVAVLAIAMTVTAPAILFQLKRDREEELIHRGTQYTRAIQHYYKKFNSYPNTLENLESSNQLRFLRRRYKDPITGKDFKLLHMQDVQGLSGPGLNGATSASTLAGGAGANGPVGLNSAGGPGGAFGGFGNQGGGPGGLSGGLNGPNGAGPGANQILQQAQNAAGGPAGSAGTNNQTGQSGTEGENQGTPQEGDNTTANGTVSGAAPGAPGTGPNAGSSFGSNNQTFGGGPFLGVASTSKDKTIRIFNKKERYYQWQFVYDPTLDQGGLIKTPYQQISVASGIQGATPAAGANGVQGQTPGGQAPGAPGGILGQPNQPVTQPNQPNQGLTPNMPPEQEQ